MKPITQGIVAVCALMLSSAWTLQAETPLGSAVTYQGRLDQSGAPASGSFPMVFTLWDAESGGNQVGPTLTFDGAGGNPPAVSVAEGLFTIPLDFGAGAFGANARWLEATVNGVMLTPRQQITPAPAALFSAAPWATSGSVISYTGGNVGIGTTTPNRRLDLRDPSDCELGLASTSSGPSRQWTLQSSSGTAPGQLSGSFQIIDRTAHVSRMLIDYTGKFGIGTTTPSARLHVANGDFQIDSGRELRFGAFNENADRIFLMRQDFQPNRSRIELHIGDEPGGGDFFDDFIISAATTIQFQFTSDARAFKGGVPVWEVLSDARMKHDIEPLTNSLDRLLQLNGRTFYYSDPTALGARPGKCTGFIAQEVEPIFPEWVGKGPDGMKTMHITGFEALTVEALRELRTEKDAEIGALRAEKDTQIASLQQENERLAERLARLEVLVEKFSSR